LSIADLPAINAGLNSASTLLLIAAYVCIRGKRVRPHAYLMISALVTSAGFLALYLYYHFHVGEVSTKGMTYLPRWLRGLYLAILFPHLILATGMLPMIVMTLIRAYQRNWVKHRRIARPTFWIWLYVSVTGVVIYWMLYHLFPMMKPS
jgi:uncharacterized membrane protein YozB (DUF420 family)